MRFLVDKKNSRDIMMWHSWLQSVGNLRKSRTINYIDAIIGTVSDTIIDTISETAIGTIIDTISETVIENRGF